jgi:hypothetical protein
MIKLKLTAIGNSLGVILPKDALGRLNVGKVTHFLLPSHRMAVD